MNKKDLPLPDTEAGPLLPGFKAVMELLSEQPSRIAKIYCLKNLRARERLSSICQRNSIPIEFCGSDFLDGLLASHDHKVAHQGLIALLTRANIISEKEIFQSLQSSPLPIIIALDQVKDPGNLGTLCRTAYALGAAGILLPKHDSASLGAAAFKASMGTLAKMPLAIVTNLARALDLAEEEGLEIYGTGSTSEHIPAENAFNFHWTLPAILVLGSEQKGIRPGVAKRCSCQINIPFQRPFDSLNIAQAGALLLGLCARSHFLN